jgi:hypothetical protein
MIVCPTLLAFEIGGDNEIVDAIFLEHRTGWPYVMEPTRAYSRLCTRSYASSYMDMVLYRTPICVLVDFIGPSIYFMRSVLITHTRSWGIFLVRLPSLISLCCSWGKVLVLFGKRNGATKNETLLTSCGTSLHRK